MQVHSMPVGEFLTTYSPAYCESWLEAFGELMADPGDREVIEQLLAEIETRGIETPVVVDPESGMLLNGMHRTTALALHDVSGPIRFVTECPDHAGEAVVEVDLRVPDVDEAMDRLCSGSSFRLDEDHWIEQVGLCGAGTGPGRCTTSWCISSVEIAEPAIAAIGDWVRRRVPDAVVEGSRSFPSLDSWSED